MAIPLAILPAQSPSSVVAVSTGGTLLPLARFDGETWINTWPAPEEYTVPVPPIARVPQKWLGMRLPGEWTLWFTTGGSVKVRPARIVRGGGCIGSPELELTSEPTAPESLFDKVHVGLATAGAPLAVEAITRVTDSHPDWARITALLTTAYAERRAQIEVPGETPNHAGILRRLASATPAMAWLFASSREAAPSAYYFEFGKQVNVDEVPIHATLSGWLVRSADGRLGVRDTWNTYTEAPETPDVPLDVPLGIVRTSAGAVWVVEHRLYEGAEFRLVEITPAGVRTVLTIDGGGC